MIKTFIWGFAVFFAACTCSYADLKVTQIKANGSFNIVLNDDIKISNILIKNNNIEMPLYKARDREYKQFIILRRDFRQYLINALSKNQISFKTEETTFKVNKFSILKKQSKIKVFASVIFNNDIEVECRIMEGMNGLWVAWPSTRKNGLWIKNFEFINKDFKKSVEEKLVRDYTDGLYKLEGGK